MLSGDGDAVTALSNSGVSPEEGAIAIPIMAGAWAVEWRPGNGCTAGATRRGSRTLATTLAQQAWRTEAPGPRAVAPANTRGTAGGSPTSGVGARRSSRDSRR